MHEIINNEMGLTNLAQKEQNYTVLDWRFVKNTRQNYTKY